jgi:FkbM family methyltransferase
MRERIWLKLRNSKSLRRLAAAPGIGRLVYAVSRALLPSYHPRRLRVQSGLGAGLWLELNPRWEFPIWQGTYEVAVQEVLEPLLRPGVTFYDVGCGPGFFSLAAARRGCSVFAFDADPQILAKAQRHAAWNGLEGRIHFVHAAVYSCTGTVFIQPATVDRGHGNAQIRADEQALETGVEVPCTTLDDFVARHTAPGIVKMDVEGAESEILKGAEQLFRSHWPVLVCEVHDGVQQSAVEGWLREHGYGWRWLEPDGPLPRHLFAFPQQGSVT